MGLSYVFSTWTAYLNELQWPLTVQEMTGFEFLPWSDSLSPSKTLPWSVGQRKVFVLSFLSPQCIIYPYISDPRSAVCLSEVLNESTGCRYVYRITALYMLCLLNLLKNLMCISVLCLLKVFSIIKKRVNIIENGM